MSKLFTILALDGGGARGLFQVSVLSRLESLIGMSFADRVDLLVGTSVGSILAAAIALDRDLTTVSSHVDCLISRLFPRVRLRRLRSLLGPLFSTDLLAHELRAFFGDDTFGSITGPALCVPSVDLSTHTPRVFKTENVAGLTADLDLPVWAACLASCSAPTYFRPARSLQGSTYYVDGGLFANCPSLVGLIEAHRMGYPLSRVRMISIGTGAPTVRPARTLARSGVLRWVPAVLDATFASQSHMASESARLLLGDHRFLRLGPPTDTPVGALDDVPAARALSAAAESVANRNHSLVAQWLQSSLR